MIYYTFLAHFSVHPFCHTPESKAIHCQNCAKLEKHVKDMENFELGSLLLLPFHLDLDAGASQAGQDIAKCINSFELTSVNANCGFKDDDQISAPTTNNIQVTVVKERVESIVQ